MLSYLVLACAVMAVTSAYAWREASDRGEQETATRIETTSTQVTTEYGRRIERALAVVNLAAATPGVIDGIREQGTIELGPAATPGGGSSAYGATARYIPPGSEALSAWGIAPAGNQAQTGVLVIDGRPAAVAISPLSSGVDSGGFILVSVDLGDITPTFSTEGNRAYFVATSPDGSLRPLSRNGAGGASTATALPAEIYRQLASGKPQETTALEDDPAVATTLFPLPGPQGWPLTALAIEVPRDAAGAAGGKTSPLLGLAVMTIALGLFIAHYLARALSRPVERITEATERVAAGDIAYQLPRQNSRDELSVLGESFNRMTRKYSSSREEVEAAAVRLEQTVVAQDAEIQTLFGISRAITSILDVKFLLRQVLALSMPLLDGNFGIVWMDLGHNSDTPSAKPDDARELQPVVTRDGGAEQSSLPLPAAHGIMVDLEKNGWQVSVLLPTDASDGEACRQLFFSREEGSAEASPVRSCDEAFREELRLPLGEAGVDATQVAVPVMGNKGFAQGLLAMTIPGRRQLSEHEALLLSNIVGLASVAVENAGLYSLTQRRGEQIETLLRESHHRITNNLAAISGMLTVQLARADSLNASSVIRDNIARIGSIAQVHRLLSGEVNDEVEVAGLIRTVSQPSISTSEAGIGLAVSGDTVVLPAKRATPVALIINELVMNSVKHGFIGRERGAIDIRITVDGADITLDYRDDGAGLSAGPPIREGGLGTQIISSLVRDELEGDWEQLPGPGYSVRLRFPQNSSSRD